MIRNAQHAKGLGTVRATGMARRMARECSGTGCEHGNCRKRVVFTVGAAPWAKSGYDTDYRAGPGRPSDQVSDGCPRPHCSHAPHERHSLDSTAAGLHESGSSAHDACTHHPSVSRRRSVVSAPRRIPELPAESPSEPGPDDFLDIRRLPTCTSTSAARLDSDTVF